MTNSQRFSFLIAVFAVLPQLLAVAEARDEVSFNLDVRPILSDRCFASATDSMPIIAKVIFGWINPMARKEPIAHTMALLAGRA